MDFSTIELDDATRAFWDEARAFCDEHVTTEVVAEEFRTGSGFNEGLHKAMGARGWIVPTWPARGRRGGRHLPAGGPAQPRAAGPPRSHHLVGDHDQRAAGGGAVGHRRAQG